MASSSFLSLSLPKPNIIKASATVSYTVPAETLNEKFSRKGIKFSESNDAPIVDLTVRNGSSLRLQIPEAHVTSYKPKVHWTDDGFEEVLYTVPSSSSSSSSSKGGIGLVLNDASDLSAKTGTSLLSSGSQWTVKDVDSDSIDALQVELSRSSGSLDVRYVVTLYPYSMTTAVIVKNIGTESVSMRSAILSHLRFRRRSKAAIQGLRGCTYCTHPPLSSPFELLSPSEAMTPDSSESQWFSLGSKPELDRGSWTEQDVPFTILTNRLSRVYAAPPHERLKRVYNTPPTKYETLDQGRELFFRVTRMGFEDIYVSSPGSFSKKYGDEYFACTGPAAMLVPLVVEPGEEWRGAQVIEHDNL